MESKALSVDILYIEDDCADVEHVKQIFEKIKKSCSFVVASNGEEALDKLCGRKGETSINPKVILIDINMKINGLDLLKTIRKQTSLAFSEVYIITNAYTTEDKLALKDLNVKGCIIKPLDYEDALMIYESTQHE